MEHGCNPGFRHIQVDYDAFTGAYESQIGSVYPDAFSHLCLGKDLLKQ